MREEFELLAAAGAAPVGVLFRTPSNADRSNNISSPITHGPGTRSSAAASAAAAKRPAAPGGRLVQHTCTPLAASLARRQRGASVMEATRSCNIDPGPKAAKCPTLLSDGASSRVQQTLSGPAARLADGTYSSPPADSGLFTEDEVGAGTTLIQHRDGLASESSSSPYYKVNVKVLVRCRPMTKEERRNGCSVVDVAPEKKEVTVRLRRGSSLRNAAIPTGASAAAGGTTQKPTLLQNSLNSSTGSSSAPVTLGTGVSKVFRFDGVCPLDYTQQNLFEEHVRPLVDEVLQGFNCTVFAYGQTGTGKTFTIEGAAPASPRTSNGNEENSDSYPSSFRSLPANSPTAVAALTVAGDASSKTAPTVSLPKAAEDMEGLALPRTEGATPGVEGAQTCPLVSSSSFMTKRSAGESHTLPTVSSASECGMPITDLCERVQTLCARNYNYVKQKDSDEYTVSCSFLEIYNEELIDLFASSSPTPLQQGSAIAKSAGVNSVNDSQNVLGASRGSHAPDATVTAAGGSTSSSRSSSSSGACTSSSPLTTTGCRLRIYEEPTSAPVGHSSTVASTSDSSCSGGSGGGPTPLTNASRAGGGSAASSYSRPLQQSGRGIVKVEGLEEKEVKSAEEVFALLRAAAPRRAFARSSMNVHSSRSHTVFSISVCVKEAVRGEDSSLVTVESDSRSGVPQSRCKSTTSGTCSTIDASGDNSCNSGSNTMKEGTTPAIGSAGRGRRRGSDAHVAVAGADRSTPLPIEEVFRVGKLNLVDLAGSENVYRSWGNGSATGAAAGGAGGNAEEKRKRECTLINKSLLTLGRCINALVEHASYIPYRDSKLTRLLQDSLGGCTKTCLIATISPAEDVVEETLNTLSYASRAKNIQNLPVKTLRHSKSSLLSSLLAQNQQLQLLLASQRERDGVFLPVPLFQQQQQEHLLLVQQSQEQQRDILSLQRQVDAFQAAEQRLQQIIDGRDAENERLQQHTKQLQDVLVAMKQRQQHLEQQLEAVQQQNQELATRLAEKLQQHISASATAVADLRKVLEEARKLNVHRCLLQDREQRTRDNCVGLAAGADVAYNDSQLQLQKLYEQLEQALVSLKKIDAARGKAAATEETLLQTQQQGHLRLQREQQQHRADALLLIQLQQQTKRKERNEQLDALMDALAQFAAECKQLRIETAIRANSTLDEVRKKQQRVAENLQAALQQQLGQGQKASTDLQQLLQESSSTHAAEAKQTCMSLRQLAQQVDEWHLQQQRLVEERTAAMAAALGQQLSTFARQQRDEVGEHSRRVQQHLQQVQQLILQQREEAADQAAAVAAAAAAAGETASTLAKTSEIGANSLLEEAQNIQAAAAETERDKGTAAEQAAARRCQQLQQDIKAVTASEEVSGQDLDAGLHRMILEDKEALTSAAAAAASDAEAWQQQRRHTQETNAAATALLQEASAAAGILHGGCKTALTEQHKLVKKCTTHILTQVLRQHSCVRGTKCLANRTKQPGSELQRPDDCVLPEAAFSYKACKEKRGSIEDKEGVPESEESENEAGDLSALCTWCAAAAAAHWLTAPDGRGTAAVAEATAAAAAAAEEVVGATAFGAAELAGNLSSCVDVTIHTSPETPVETSVHAVAATPEAGRSELAGGGVLTDGDERLGYAGERVSAEFCADRSPLHVKQKAEERLYQTEEASESTKKTTTLLQERVSVVGTDENVHDETVHMRAGDVVATICESSQSPCHLREGGEETSLSVHAAQRRGRCAHTGRRSSREDAIHNTERSHETTPHSKPDSSSFSSNKYTDRSLPSRSTTSSSTSWCSSSAGRDSSSRREGHAGKECRISRRGRTQCSQSRPSQSKSQSPSEKKTEEGNNALSAQHHVHEQHGKQQEPGDVKEAKTCATLISPSLLRNDVFSTRKLRELRQRLEQLNRQHTKSGKHLQQRGGLRIKQPLVKLLPFAKKRGAEEGINKSQQERYARAEVLQHQRQHHGRYHTRERPLQLLGSSQAQVHHYHQREKPPVQLASPGDAEENTLLSSGSSGPSSSVAEERTASLSHPASQPGLRRSRSGENIAHTEADKRKKVGDEAMGNTESETYLPILPAT